MFINIKIHADLWMTLYFSKERCKLVFCVQKFNFLLNFFKFYFLLLIIFKVNEQEINLPMQFAEFNIGGMSCHAKYRGKV